jgi:hypothetical protein
VSSAWGLAIFAVTLLPYLYAYATQPQGKVFNGFFFIADDAATYISKMREGAEGAWGWTDRYITTPKPQPVLLFEFYILWGKLAALLHISLFAAYHLARLSGAIALVYAARTLAASVLPEASRRLAVILTMVGSGAGFLLLLLGSLAGRDSLFGARLEALDLHLPELGAFYSVLAIPHFAWAAALVAVSLVQLMAIGRVADGRARLRPATLAAISLLALILVVALLYIPNPVNIQRRLIDGLYIPIAMLAAVGIGLLGEGLKTRNRRRVAFSLVSMSAVSTLLVLGIAFRFAAARDPIIYLDRGEVDAFSWLSDHRGAGMPPGVLSAAETGLDIPAWAGDRVYVGHYSETINYLVRARLAHDAICAGDPGLGAFMAANDAKYLFIGPNERAQGVGALGAELFRVYDRGGVQIYRLRVPLPAS